MKRTLSGLLVMVWLATGTLAMAADQWVHIKVVESGEDGERVRVNIPLSLAEKVLPTINADKFCHGKIKVDNLNINEVDLRALLEAVRTAQDNEYVTVDSKHENVRVAKAGGYLLIKVRETQERKDKDAKPDSAKAATSVDVKVPFSVVNALLSGGKDELDVMAALRALGEYPDLDLVRVEDGSSTVRVWIDSKNVADPGE